MIGRDIAHYKITEKLGQGGMGEVYLAEDSRLKRKVALKFLPENLSAVGEARQRFLREAQAAAALNHPNIVTIYEVAEYDGIPFMAMEFIDGQTLKKYCADDKRPLDDLLGIARQIGSGLQRAHQAGITHRDLKPGNIIIDSNGTAKIVDFGLAQVRGAAKLTQTGSTLGTASYMSPEQAQGRDVDHRADLFSFGAVLFEMIAGRPAFAGEHDAAIVYSIVHEEPQPLARYNSDVPDELQRIVSKCLAKSPDQRYQSAGDLLADLHALRESSSSSSSMNRASLTPRRKMIAVLPFENLGPAEDEYFADGITEEIISRLSTVGELGVISRTSVMQYKDTRKSMRDIGRELGTDYILEGTVRWGRTKEGPSRVRITPQLIQVSDDTHLWSDRYDKLLEDIFDVQSNIAEQVIDQLNVTLLDKQKAALEAKPTDNIDAYQAFLRGKEYNWKSYLRHDFNLAINMFEKAVAHDPMFAHAWAYLSRAHSNMYHHGWDRTDDRIAKSKAAVDRAIQLDPGSYETRIAYGMFQYRCHHMWSDALREFESALTLQPNSTELQMMIGATKRRLGHIEDALQNFRQAAELSPRSALMLLEVGSTLAVLHRFDEALSIYDRVRAMQPDNSTVYMLQWVVRIHADGNVAAAKQIWEANPRADDPDVAHIRAIHHFYMRELEPALQHLNRYPRDVTDDQPWVHPRTHIPAALLLAQGKMEEARAKFAEGVPMIERELAARPKDHRLHAALGVAHAGADHREVALESIERACGMMNLSIDAMGGCHPVYQYAQVASLLGDSDLALSKLEQVFSRPSWLSRWLVRLDPVFDGIRNNPNFKEFIDQPDKVF